MSNQEWFKSRITGSIFKTLHVGENYVLGLLLNKPDIWGYSVNHPISQIEWCEDPTKIKVGDYVRPSTSPASSSPDPDTWYKVLHIHQEEGDDRRWIVYAYKGDIPYAAFEKDLIKKLSDVQTGSF